MACEMKNKKGQVTVFIIVAVLIVVAIILFFFLAGKTPIDIFKPSMPNPQEYIEKCAIDAAKQAIDIMMPQGGYISPVSYKLYNNSKIAYLCYNKNYYYSCINQEPLYIERLQKEIQDYIKPKIEDCFFALKQDYTNKNYLVDMSFGEIKVILMPKQVDIEISKRFEISKNEEARKFDKFKVRFSSPLFDLANVAREIVNQEAKYCNFEYIGYMLFYPQFNIDKKSIGEGGNASKIYIVQDRITSKRLNIAVRGCAIPPGF